MKKIFFVMIAAAFLQAPEVFAQEPAPRTRVETLLKSFTPGEMNLALETFAKNSLIKPELVDSLQTQMSVEFTLENPVIGSEFLQEQNVGQSLKRLTYVVKTAKEPFFWTFSFYKPESRWVSLSVTFTREF